MNQRQKRSKNIKIFGSKELSNITKDQRQKCDSDLVAAILNQLGSQKSLVKTFRLGKFDHTLSNRARPIKVCLDSEDAAIHLLRNAKKLKLKTEFAGITISSDRTPAQNQFYKSVNEELRVRTSTGECNLKIKYKNGILTIISEN